MKTRNASALASTLLSLSAFIAVPTMAWATPRCEGKLVRKQIDERQESTLVLLRGRRLGELQERMDRLLAAYTVGTLSDEELFYEFGAFDRWSPALTPIFKEWVERFPASYAAHQAMALHMYSVAWQMRGSALAHETSNAQMDEFHRRLDDARQWVASAMKLHPKPILAFQQLMTNAKAERVSAEFIKSIGLKPATAARNRSSPRPDVLSVLDAANRLQPDNSIVRTAYVTVLAPRWGGTLEALEEYAKATSHPGLPADRLAAVSYAALMEIGSDYEFRKQPERAIPYYEQASKHCRQNLPFINIARIRIDQKRYAEALEASNAAVALVPDGSMASRYRAYALSGVGRHKEAVDVLKRLAPEGSSDVAYFLGEYYARGEGGLKQDLDEARRLFGIAARGGDERAIRRLEGLKATK